MATTQTSDATFAVDVVEQDLPVLVDYWAPWCGPCRVLDPVLEEISESLAGRLRIVKLNTEDNPVTPGAYAITHLPTLQLFIKGEVVTTLLGPRPKQKLIDEISEHLPT